MWSTKLHLPDSMQKCNQQYIGETMNFYIWTLKHNGDARNCRDNAIGEHFNSPGHSMSACTTLKSAIAAPRRNCGRRYPILLCHLLTQNWQNQKFRCSPETFRLSFYGIQGVPKKIWAFDITVLQGSKGKILVSTTGFQNLGSNWAQFFFGTPWIP